MCFLGKSCCRCSKTSVPGVGSVASVNQAARGMERNEERERERERKKKIYIYINKKKQTRRSTKRKEKKESKQENQRLCEGRMVTGAATAGVFLPTLLPSPRTPPEGAQLGTHQRRGLGEVHQVLPLLAVARRIWSGVRVRATDGPLPRHRPHQKTVGGCKSPTPTWTHQCFNLQLPIRRPVTGPVRTRSLP